MKGWKKVVASLLAATTVFSAGIMSACGNGEKKEHKSFVKAIGGTSETYQGKVSTQTYTTKDLAVKACLEEEFAGEFSTILQIVEKTATSLDATAVAKLNLPATATEGMQSVEKVEVEYSQRDTIVDLVTTSAPEAKSKKVTIYILQYTNHFKYYTACPAEGETITKSYYESLFANDCYDNCTVESSASMELEMEYNGESVNMEVSLEQLIKITENALYIEVSTSTKGQDAGGSKLDQEKVTLYAYAEVSNLGPNVFYVKENETDGWANVTASNFENLLERDFDLDLDKLDMPFADEYLDYAFFTKTDYGFELNVDNANKYLQEMLDDEYVQYLGEGGAIDMFAKYYVHEGILSGMRMNVSMDASVTVGAYSYSVKMKVSGETKVTDYGSTVVENPVIK